MPGLSKFTIADVEKLIPVLYMTNYTVEERLRALIEEWEKLRDSEIVFSYICEECEHKQEVRLTGKPCPELL